LAANLHGDDALGNVLISGLNAEGIPRELAGTAFVFHHNKPEELTRIGVEHPDLAAVIFEIQRHEKPSEDFLEALVDIKLDTGAVVICDEITSGFRLNAGGAHLLYDFEPDMACFGKSLGAGHPVSAVIGKREIMESARRTFISSTYWTWRTGYAAANAMIDKFSREQTHEKLIENGKRVHDILLSEANGCGLEANIGHEDMYPLIYCRLPDRAAQTLMTQMFLQYGILFGGDFYSTAAHSGEVVEQFQRAVKAIFPALQRAIEADIVLEELRGPTAREAFQRLTE